MGDSNFDIDIILLYYFLQFKQMLDSYQLVHVHYHSFSQNYNYIHWRHLVDTLGYRSLCHRGR